MRLGSHGCREGRSLRHFHINPLQPLKFIISRALLSSAEANVTFLRHY